MGKVDIEILMEAIEKGFHADSTATLGDSVRDAKNYLKDISEAKDVI